MKQRVQVHVSYPYVHPLRITCAQQYHLSTVPIPFRQGHQVAAVDDGIDIRIVDVELLEPVGIDLADGDVALQHLLRHRQIELLRSEEAQQEERVGPAMLDRGMLLDPVAKLLQRLPPRAVILAQLQPGYLQRLCVQRALVLMFRLLPFRYHSLEAKVIREPVIFYPDFFFNNALCRE